MHVLAIIVALYSASVLLLFLSACRLVVLDTSIVDQETIFDHDLSGSHSWNDELPLGFSDEKIVTTVNAQLHSMETYINPNVENVLGMVHHNPDFLIRMRHHLFPARKTIRILMISS